MLCRLSVMWGWGSRRTCWEPLFWSKLLISSPSPSSTEPTVNLWISAYSQCDFASAVSHLSHLWEMKIMWLMSTTWASKKLKWTAFLVFIKALIWSLCKFLVVLLTYTVLVNLKKKESYENLHCYVCLNE